MDAGGEALKECELLRSVDDPVESAGLWVWGAEVDLHLDDSVFGSGLNDSDTVAVSVADVTIWVGGREEEEREEEREETEREEEEKREE